MGAIESAVVEVYMADGGFSHPADRGRFVGGGFVWESDKRWFRDYIVYQPTAIQTTGPAYSDHPELPAAAQATDPALSGVMWEEGLGGVVLAWRMRPQNIDMDWWFGPLQTEADGRTWRPGLVGKAVSGQWREIQPGGNFNVTSLQQYKVSPDEWSLTSYGKLAANPKFTVSMYREWTPGSEDLGNDQHLPYIYTGFSFGGRWHLRFPKWKSAELYKLVGGKWKLVATKDWSGEELYGDSYGAKEILATVWCTDGKLLIKSSASEDSWVYQEATPITVATAPLTLSGNGGSCYFGKHSIEFARGSWNVLLARDRTTLDRMPEVMPEAICSGSKPAGTYARAYLANDDGTEIKEPVRSFRLGVVLFSADGTDTPVVRCAGVQLPPVSEAGPQIWRTTQRFISAKGGWSCDLEERMVKQSYDVVMDNSDGFFAGTRANKLIAIHVGRPGVTGPASSYENGRPRRRVTSVCEIDEHDDSSLAEHQTRLRTKDRLDMLDEIECGERPPLDDWTVAQAMREVLTWGHVRAEEIGYIWDSGVRLPSSAWAMARALQNLNDNVSGDLDSDSGAACRLRPDLSVKGALRFLMNFDYGTFAMFDELGLYQYQVLNAPVVRTFRVTEALAAEDEICRVMSRRPRLSEGKTSVIVGGRDRSTGRPLTSRAYDYEALTRAYSHRFRGWDVTERKEDSNLNEQRLVNLRCRFDYEWVRRLRDLATYGAIGQTLQPLTGVSIVGYGDWFVLNPQEEFDRDGAWEMTVDLVSI